MEWQNVKRIDSSEGNVAKFVYTKDDAVAESVLYRYPTYKERTVICCSTQSGCPVGCRFCGAGDHFVRNLTANEIIDQVDYSIKQTGANPEEMDRLQIMFMSMGEPLLNLDELIKALHILHLNYPNAALLISTIGPKLSANSLMDLLEVSAKIPTIGLQFSVHEPTDEARNKLIPIKGKLALHEIAKLGSVWHNATGRKPFFNYCAGSHNTRDEDANELLFKFDPSIFCATVSVICERNEGMPARNEYQMQLAQDFSSKLVQRGYDVRVFDPAGQDDIGGGCGQLWFVQQWMADNPDKAKASVGNGKPKVHVPVKEVF